MIDKLFTSKKRVKLLEVLLLNPKKEYHLRGISRITDTVPTHAKKELTKLKEIGLIKEKKKGNLTLFRINENCPIYPELKKIFLKTRGVKKALKENLKKYEKIKYALIFGSLAEGKEKETSDVDLLIVGKIKEENLQEAIMKFEEKIGRETNYILWTEEELKRKTKEKIPLIKEIAKGQVIMIKGDEDEFRRTIKQK